MRLRHLTITAGLLVAALVPMSATAQPPNHPLIIGGSDATSADGGFVAWLSTGCSGALIAPTWVLTAAHCLQDESGRSRWTSSARVWFWSDGYVSVPALRVISHPDYAYPETWHDVGLVELAAPVGLTPVPLLGADQQVPMWPGSPARFFGWGSTIPFDKTDPTQRGEFPSRPKVTEVTIGYYTSRFMLYLDNEVTTATSGCYGDSGGPLVVSTPDGGRAVAGVFTYVKFACPTGATMINGYAKVASYLPWIESHVGWDHSTGSGGTDGLTFVEPIRVYDSRIAKGELGPAGDVVSLQHLAPTGASGVIVNLTTVWPFGTAHRAHVSIGSCDRQEHGRAKTTRAGDLASASMVVLDRADKICIKHGDGHAVIDIVGWVVPGGDGVRPVTPMRVLDTRTGDRPSPTAPMQPLTIDLAAAGVPTGATAAVVNLTAIGRNLRSYVTAFECARPVPATSTLNVDPGGIAPNQTVVPLGGSSTICVMSNESIDLVVDLVGWVGPAFSSTVQAGFEVVRHGMLIEAGEPQPVTLTGSGAIPHGSTGAFVSVDLRAFGAAGYLTLWPCTEPRPFASTLNFEGYGPATGTALVALDANGELCGYSPERVVINLEVVGWVA